jgi:hypothetical protein
LRPRLIKKQSVEFDSFLSGHLNSMMGYLGSLIAGKVLRRFVAQKYNINEDKVFIFLNLSGGPACAAKSSTAEEWWLLSGNDLFRGGIRVEVECLQRRSGTGFHIHGIRDQIDDLINCESYREKVVVDKYLANLVSCPFIEKKLTDVVNKLGYVPLLDIIAIYCPSPEDAGIIFAEVKATRSRWEYDISSSQRKAMKDLKKLGYDAYLLKVRFEGSVQSPSAIVGIYKV